MKTSIQLATQKHGYRDYDISGYADIYRACVPFKPEVGDLFNIYRGKSRKEGCTWTGDLNSSLQNHINKAQA